MARRRSPIDRLALMVTAVAGVVVGHSLSYALAVPWTESRATLLSETGHSYWPLAVRLALFLGICVPVLLALRRITGPSRQHDQTEGIPRLALRLGALQVVLFCLTEVTERVLSGAPVRDLVDQPRLLALGVAVQLLVACLGALVLRWWERAIDTALETAGRDRLCIPHPCSERLPWPEIHGPLGPRLAGGTGARGPPSL